MLTALAAFSPTASADSVEITEFPLASDDLYPGPITAGPDGNMWFLNARAAPRVQQLPQSTPEIDRIAPDGQITRFPLPPKVEFPNEITAGPDGNMWFSSRYGIGRVTSTGGIVEFSTPSVKPEFITAGPASTLWFTARSGKFENADTIGRSTTDGQITEFTLPGSNLYPGAITMGPDGNLWFTEYFGNKIGRITPEGQITEFPLPREESRPQGMTVGPDGNLWFTLEVPGVFSGIGRITPEGQITEFPLPAVIRDGFAGQIATGGDGRLWFIAGLGSIGRITPDGRLSKVMLPDPETGPVDLAPGPDGSIWYSARGEGPCRAGGGTCMISEPEKPGVIGRIAPGLLTAAVASKRVPVSGRWIKLRIACEGGNANDICRGRLRLGIRPQGDRKRVRGMPGSIVIARRRYSLLTDSSRKVSLRLDRRALLGLDEGRGRALPALITASVSGGEASDGRVVLRLRRAGPIKRK